MLNLPRALPSFYSTSAPNEDVFLTREEVRITSSDNEVQGVADVYLKFLPKPRLLFEVDCPTCSSDTIFSLFSDEAVTNITLLERGVSGEVVLIRTTDAGLTAALKKGPLVAEPLREPLHIIFHLLNFHDFIANPVSFAPDSGHIGQGSRVILRADGWKVTLDSLPNTGDRIKSLKNIGGYAITHVGKLERSNGAAFPIDEAQILMSALHYFLSFARGLWSAPILSTGLNAESERVWEEWGARLADPWQSVFLSWFGPHHGNALSDIFPGFVARWQDETWRDAVKTVIHLYIESNKQAGALNGSVVLTQTALELLSWVYFVQEKQRLSSDGFKRLPASDQLGLLISEAGIPLDIPACLSDLSRVARELNLNGPEALAETRNSIVHPGHKQKDKLASVMFEVWNLGLWYIELILLHLFGFGGEYANRLKPDQSIGEVELVPWATVKSSNPF
jgi:hypothetical protein